MHGWRAQQKTVNWNWSRWIIDFPLCFDLGLAPVRLLRPRRFLARRSGLRRRLSCPDRLQIEINVRCFSFILYRNQYRVGFSPWWNDCFLLKLYKSNRARLLWNMWLHFEMRIQLKKRKRKKKKLPKMLRTTSVCAVLIMNSDEFKCTRDNGSRLRHMSAWLIFLWLYSVIISL